MFEYEDILSVGNMRALGMLDWHRKSNAWRMSKKYSIDVIPYVSLMESYSGSAGRCLESTMIQCGRLIIMNNSNGSFDGYYMVIGENSCWKDVGVHNVLYGVIKGVQTREVA